jgi:hypothetical protein
MQTCLKKRFILNTRQKGHGKEYFTEPCDQLCLSVTNFDEKSAKRNYTIDTFMAVLIIFGHWMDFNQMVMASISKIM